MYDVVIIGAGITGSMLAKDLSCTDLKIAWIDKENDVADGATMANSAIVHTGYDPEDGTLKAHLNVEGALMYPKLCEELGCRIKKTGAFVVATSNEEEDHLQELCGRAKRRRIPYEWLSGEEARAQEPNLSDAVTRVLSFPTTSVIYPWEVAIACAQVAVANGTELLLNHPCTGIDRSGEGYIVHTPDRDLSTRWILNCAGTGCAAIHEMIAPCPYKTEAKKGQYFVLDSQIDYVHHVIFPVPGKMGKGVLAVPTVYGNTLLGPDSHVSNDPEDLGCTSEGLDFVRKQIQRTMKNVPFGATIRSFAGLRPSTTMEDFVIEEVEGAPRFVDVASIASPGLASAPAISRFVIRNIIQPVEELHERPEAVRMRRRPLVLSELSEEERNRVIAQNPAYGTIICRCEQISEGEIVDCIHAMVGARTVKAVKKRVRPGMGRCQGGFCEPRVVEILARELKKSPMEILLDEEGSRILEGENR